jgi:hypothetical protein
MRQEQSFLPTRDAWGDIKYLKVEDGFLFDCLIPLHLSERCANNFAARLNENPLKKYTIGNAYKVWNSGGNPVRDFLLVVRIDYPECFPS